MGKPLSKPDGDACQCDAHEEADHERFGNDVAQTHRFLRRISGLSIRTRDCSSEKCPSPVIRLYRASRCGSRHGADPLQRPFEYIGIELLLVGGNISPVLGARPFQNGRRTRLYLTEGAAPDTHCVNCVQNVFVSSFMTGPDQFSAISLHGKEWR